MRISTRFSCGKCILMDADEENKELGGKSLSKEMVPVLSAMLVKASRNKACVTSHPKNIPSCRKLWHRRFGHPSNAILQCMAEEHGDGFPQKWSEDSVHCHFCVDAKQNKSSSTESLVKEEQDHVVTTI